VCVCGECVCVCDVGACGVCGVLCCVSVWGGVCVCLCGVVWCGVCVVWCGVCVCVLCLCARASGRSHDIHVHIAKQNQDRAGRLEQGSRGRERKIEGATCRKVHTLRPNLVTSVSSTWNTWAYY
jgi:hypothetical protein